MRTPRCALAITCQLRLDSHRKYFRANRIPATAHPPRTARSATANPKPPVRGSKANCKALARCWIGNISASVLSQAGAVSSGKKIPEMNSKGKMEKLTIAGAASEFGQSPGRRLARAGHGDLDRRACSGTG